MSDNPTLEELAALHLLQHLCWLLAHEAAQLSGRPASQLYNEAPGSGTVEAIRRGRYREYADLSPRDLYKTQQDAAQRVVTHLAHEVAEAVGKSPANILERYTAYAERVAKEQGTKISIGGRSGSFRVHLVDLPAFERVEAYL